MAKKQKNPFTPTIGIAPELFLGRASIRQGYVDVLSNPNNALRTSMLLGVRGVGKTSLMKKIQDDLKNAGAKTVFVTSSTNLAQDVLRQLLDFVGETSEEKLKLSLNLGIESVEYSNSNTAQQVIPSLYPDGKQVLDKLKAKKHWIIFFVDEAHANVDQIVEFSKAYQQWLGDGYKLMLIMGGLPDAIHNVLDEESATFMRRAKKVPTNRIKSNLDILNMYRDVFNNSGKQVTDEQLQQLVDVAEGYPYLVQLLGSYAWELSDGHGVDIAKVIKSAQNEMVSSVFELLLRSRSEMDIEYLTAIAQVQKNGRSKTADVVAMLGKSQQYISQYRKRAKEASLIQTEYGYVSFTIPMLGDYLLGKITTGDDFDYVAD